MQSKVKFKKILRGIAITVIIYITVSMLATKFIYDAIFERYSAVVSESILFDNEQKFSFKSGKNNLEAILCSADECEQGLIIFVPGLKAEVVEYAGVINSFVQQGFDVFAFNPTGHGKSGGDSSIGFSQIVADLDSAVEFVRENLEYDDIFLFGHSRGGFASCCVMNSYDNIKAVVTINSTDTAMDAIMAYSTDYVGTIAYGNYFFLDAYQNLLFDEKISNRSVIEEINKSSIPVLVIQAKNDEKIPVDKFSAYSKRNHVVSKNAEFLLYDKSGRSGHTSILYDGDGNPNTELVDIISDFYKKYDNKDIEK